jgi:RNA polymerase sigma-70 factor (ECF subfamily)
MGDDAPFSGLMARVRDGDQAAADELFRRFSVRLTALACQRLGPLARGKVEPEDVVQSVFRTFFRRQAKGQLAPRCWTGLLALLTKITLRKCGHKLAYLVAARRDVRREVPLASPTPDPSEPGWLVLAKDPTPFHAAVLADTAEQIACQLSERHRTIFRLSLEGHNTADIATQTELSERTVQRVLEHVRQILREMAAREEAE